jgi:C4-dicarboxylate-specific signal transduction histidine kinase
MNGQKEIKFGYKALLSLSSVVAILLISIFIYLNSLLRDQAIKNSNDSAKLISKDVIAKIRDYFREAYLLNRTHASNFVLYKQNNIPRKTVYRIMKGSLIQNPKFLCIWTMWEPNKFDNRDQYYANDCIHDPKGTFAMAYYFDDNEIKTEINDTSDFKEDYYTIPKKLKQPVIIDPFHYQYHGNEKVYFETSMEIPILENDTFIGVIGIDIDLYDLQEQFKNLKVFKNGFISILSNSGRIVTHPDSSIIDTDPFLTSKNSNPILDGFKTGNEFTSNSLSEFSKENAFRYFIPINMEYMVDPWYIMVEIPQKEIFEYANRIRTISFIALATLLLLLVYVTYTAVERRKWTAQLNKYSINLEEQVQLRTQEIETLNEELRQSNDELMTTNEALLQQKEELINTLERLKETQKQLIQSEKMASIGVLTAGIAHEINNPINFINSSLHILKNTIESSVKPINEKPSENNLAVQKILKTFSTLLTNMQTGTDRIVEIIKGLGIYARNDENAKTLTNIHETIDSTLVLLNNKLKNKISVVKHYGNIPSINCYQVKISQVIMNIISNAIDSINEKSNNEHGRIIITTLTEQSLVMIKICDNGTGIAEKDVDHIFEPFFTTKHVGKGSGLGLYISHSIVEKHNGRIIVNRIIEGGTEFIIELPL